MKPAKSRAFTLIELAVIIAVLALLVVLFLPALRRAQEDGMRAECSGNLKEVGIAFKTWAFERTNGFPMMVSADKGGTRESAETGLAFPQFQALTNELSTPRVLLCPTDKHRTAAKDFSSLSNTNISYFVGLDSQEDYPQMLMAGDRNVTNGTPLPSNRILVLTTNSMLGWTHELHSCRGNILLADGSVQQVSSSGLTNLVSNSVATNRLAIP